MLQVLAGLALFGAVKVLETKMKGNIDKEDWDEISTADKVARTVSGVKTTLEDDVEKTKSRFAQSLRSKSDSEIRAALKNIPETDWKYELIEAEAYRRNIS